MVGKIGADKTQPLARPREAGEVKSTPTPEEQGAAREIPATPAAMPGLPKDVSDNLQAPGPEQTTTSIHARIQQMGRPVGRALGKVEKQVERFLQDERVSAVGQGIAEVAHAGVNLSATGIDALVSTVGDGTDAVTNRMIEGDSIETLAAVGKAKLQAGVEDLREKALGMVAEGERLMAKVDELDDKSRAEAQKLWASGKALLASATRIQHFMENDKEELKAWFAKGGSAVLKVASDVFEGVTELAHKGAEGLAAAISVSGRFLKWLVGKDTLRSTAISIYGGLRMNAISQKLNAGVGGGFFFPSFKEAESLVNDKRAVPSKKDETPPESYADCCVFDWGVSAASPVAGAGWNSRGGAGAGVNLYFISATFNEMTERVFIGVPGVWGVTLGRDRERGSEINFGNGVGLAGGDKLGAYATYGVAVHTPLLDPVNKYVTRPIAKCIVKLTRLITGSARATYSRITGAHGERGGDIEPPSGSPSSSSTAPRGDPG